MSRRNKDRKQEQEQNTVEGSEVPMREEHGVAEWPRCLTERRYITQYVLAVLLVFLFSQASAKCQTSATESGQQAAKHASAYNWIQSPAMPAALVAGANTITLKPCPRGLRRADPPGLSSRVAPHEYLYIVGTGDPESALITGGAGHGGDPSCTVEVSLKQSHPAGYSAGSATGGIKEASEDAMFLAEPYGAGVRRRQGGMVVLDTAGSPYKVHAPIYIEASNQVVSGAGGTIDCYLLDEDCMKVGDSNSNHFGSIQLEHLRFHPNLVGGTNSALYVNANATIIRDVTVLYSSTHATFGHLVTVCDDQAFTLDGLNYLGFGLRNDAKFVGSVVFAPGPFNKCSAVGWLKNMQISGQGAGNGIDWQSGNSLHVSDSVIQGFSQFGIRTGTMRGGYAPTQIDNVYMELNTPVNPVGNIGAAGIIVVGSRLSAKTGMLAIGHQPSYAQTGSTHYVYWIVAKDPTRGSSLPLQAGYASTNGKGSIPVSWPKIDGEKISYDVLRTEGAGNALNAPHGKGDFAVAIGVPQCAGQVCQATDSQAPLQTYEVSKNPSFQPILMFWPGSLVLSGGAYADLVIPPVTNISPVVSTMANVPSLFVDRCPTGTPGVYAVCLAGESAGNNQPRVVGTLMQNGPGSGGPASNVKGRLNFLNSPAGSVAPSHIITLVDSDPAKTIADGLHRPSNDDKDTYIGLDVGAGGAPLFQSQLALGAPVSISNYIANKGDGTRWKERLTASEKTFAVPVTIQKGNTLTVGEGSALSRMKIYSTPSVATATVAAQSCKDVTQSVSGLTKSDLISAITPSQSLGNLSLNAYASATDTLTLHFCNPTTSGVGIPSGAYSFLSVH
jgi:hypothetical protein